MVWWIRLAGTDERRKHGQQIQATPGNTGMRQASAADGPRRMTCGTTHRHRGMAKGRGATRIFKATGTAQKTSATRLRHGIQRTSRGNGSTSGVAGGMTATSGGRQ